MSQHDILVHLFLSDAKADTLAAITWWVRRVPCVGEEVVSRDLYYVVRRVVTREVSTDPITVFADIRSPEVSA